MKMVGSKFSVSSPTTGCPVIGMEFMWRELARDRKAESTASGFVPTSVGFSKCILLGNSTLPLSSRSPSNRLCQKIYNFTLQFKIFSYRINWNFSLCSTCLGFSRDPSVDSERTGLDVGLTKDTGCLKIEAVWRIGGSSSGSHTDSNGLAHKTCMKYKLRGVAY